MTKSHVDALRGVQVPSSRLSPRSVDSEDAEDAIVLGARYGLRPDPWQELVLRDWLGRGADGKWSAPKAALTVPRQNGKNALLEIRELFGIVILGEKWLHTAHEVKTARRHFIRLSSFFENPRKYPELAALVQTIRKTNGQEAIVLTNGGSVDVSARSKGAARGFTVDCLAVDEAQELGEDALEALLPTISSGPLGNPQQIYTGTPPGPLASGEVFTRLRASARKGLDDRLSWLEWSMLRWAATLEDRDALNLDDRRLWAQANPSLAIRLHVDVAQDERNTLSPEGFARERGGAWAPDNNDGDISAERWADLADGTSVAPVKIAVAFDVSIDRSHGSIALYGRRPDGIGHLELVEAREGVDWMVPRLIEIAGRNELAAPLCCDHRGPAGGLVPDLEDAGVEVLAASAMQVNQACASLLDGMDVKQFRHTGQAQLTAQVLQARKQPSGDAWRWSRRGVDISGLYAITLARWAYMTREEAPRPLVPSIHFI